MIDRIKSEVVNSVFSLLGSVLLIMFFAFQMYLDYSPVGVVDLSGDNARHYEAVFVALFTGLVSCFLIIYILKKPGFRSNFNMYLKGLKKSSFTIDKIENEFKRIDEDKLGLPHCLGSGSERPSSLSTTYGAKALLLSSDLSYLGFDRIVNYLESVKSECGSWNAASQTNPSPEVTAEVVNFYAQVKGVDSDLYRNAIGSLKSAIDRDSNLPVNTLAVSSILENLPESDKELDSIKKDLGNMIFHGFKDNISGSFGWGWELQPDTNTTQEIIVSAPATARCLIAIGKHKEIFSEKVFQDKAEKAINWLLKKEEYLEEYSEINRTVDQGLTGSHAKTEVLTFKHFTSALVLIAACKWSGLKNSKSLADKALAEMLEGDSERLWALNDGKTPVWMSYQGMLAVKLYGEALTEWCGNVQN